MTGLLAILGVGFLLGIRHATDPDHVIAVSTIVSRERSIAKAGWIGVLWGLGHTFTILIVGSAMILLHFAIPVRIGLTMELSVGIMLIALGVLNLTGAMKWMSEKLSPAHPPVEGHHLHIHGHGTRLHFHWHAHSPHYDHHGTALTPPRWLRWPFLHLGLYHALRPLVVGIVHGLAGSAAVALLVLGAIRDPAWSVLYLLIFGFGTILGMMLITAAMALPFSLANSRIAWLNRGLITASGLLSLVFGLFVSYQIGFVDGLFTSNPLWIPR